MPRQEVRFDRGGACADNASPRLEGERAARERRINGAVAATDHELQPYWAWIWYTARAPSAY